MQQNLPSGFKTTELGPLPEEWNVVEIVSVIRDTLSGDWGKTENEGNGNWSRCQVIRGTDFPSIANGQFGNVPERYVKLSSIRKRQLNPDDILVEISGGSKRQPTGRILQITTDMLSQTELPLLFTNFLKLLRLDTNIVEPSFFRLFWEYLYDLGRTRIYEKRTTGIRNFKYKEFLVNERIPLPPLPEQRAIAHVLRTVQRANEATEGVIAAARELKKSLMRHLFTYGPVPLDQADQVPLKETEIGPVPEGWKVVKLGEVGEIITGKTPSTTKSEFWDGSIPFITPPDLNGRAIRWANRSITEKGLSQAKPLPRGTVLVSCIGYIGKTGIVDADVAVTNQQINAIILRSTNNWFLAYMIEYHAPFLISRARMTTVPILSKSGLSSTLIPLPPLPEQREIAHILQAVDRKIEAEERRKAALEALFKTLLHHLMTGKIRVPVGTGFKPAPTKAKGNEG